MLPCSVREVSKEEVWVWQEARLRCNALAVAHEEGEVEMATSTRNVNEQTFYGNALKEANERASGARRESRQTSMAQGVD